MVAIHAISKLAEEMDVCIIADEFSDQQIRREEVNFFFELYFACSQPIAHDAWHICKCGVRMVWISCIGGITWLLKL